MKDRKFILFDQDEEGICEFDSLTEFSAQVVKIAVDEKRRGACYAVAVTNSRGYRYFAGVYETQGKAARQIRQLKRWVKKMQNQEGNFGFKFANDREITPIVLLDILNADRLIDDEGQRLETVITELQKLLRAS